MHYPDIFYRKKDMTYEEKVEIINYCKDICYNWWTDKLDCSESWTRQRIEMSFEDIMKKFSNSCHFVIIHRRGDDERKNNDIWKWKLEVGFCTMGGGVDYYLWIEVDEDKIPTIIEKFNLEKNL